ncbi:MAG: NAD-dependent epimerase/dehydratase family protein [Fidelibacterota bacterium]
MKILVTGGAGFIGSHVQDAYLKAGHQVAVLDNLSTGQKEFIHPDAIFYRADIRDAREVFGILDGGNFDVVNHHAAQMDVRASVRDPAYDASVNILGGLNLLEAAVKTGVKQFIFASTGGAIYGEQNTFPAPEDHPLSPESPYGVSKLSLEKYCDFYTRTYGLRAFILRYGNVYGPRQNPHGEAGVVAIFSEKLVRGETPTIHGDGEQTRDFVHVSDAVRANLMALEFDGNAVTNIGTGVESNINTVFRHLVACTGNSAEAKHGPPKKGEQRRSVLDYSRVKTLLGWEPTVGIREGLRQTYRYFADRRSKSQ